MYYFDQKGVKACEIYFAILVRSHGVHMIQASTDIYDSIIDRHMYVYAYYYCVYVCMYNNNTNNI